MPEAVPKIMLNVSFQMRALLLLSSQSNILGGTAGANISNSKLFGLIRLFEYIYTYLSLVGVVYVYICCEPPNEFESLHTKPLSELGTAFLLTTYVTDTQFRLQSSALKSDTAIVRVGSVLPASHQFLAYGSLV
jgi:hypothetical protein